MEQSIHSFYRKLKDTVGQATQTIKEKLEDLIKVHTVTTADMAGMIQQHPDVVILEQTLLDITYRTYRLRIEDMSFYMETRAVHQPEEKSINGERILLIDVRSPGQTLFSYRSYENKMKLNEPVRVEHLLEYVVQGSRKESLA